MCWRIYVNKNPSPSQQISSSNFLTQALTHDHLPSFLRSKLPNTNQQPSDPDLDSDMINPGSGSEVWHLEEAIHSIVARKLAWILFMPGSSYWVPPPLSVEEVVGRVRKQMMSAEEEKMSLKSARGWPSRAYFMEEKSSFGGYRLIVGNGGREVDGGSVGTALQRPPHRLPPPSLLLLQPLLPFLCLGLPRCLLHPLCHRG